MRTALALLTVLAVGVLAACGGSSTAETTATDVAATQDATATTDGPAPTCSDENIVLVSQQIIGTLNAMQTDITKQWFVMQKVQDAGVERVKAEVEQMKLQADALKTCTVLSEDQAKLVPAALGALKVGETFATTTLELVSHDSLKADIDALKQSKKRMNALTLQVNEAFAAFSTQWEAWKLNHR